MGEFENYLLLKFSNAILKMRHSPYAIGMDIYWVEDDLRRPAVRLITNTREHAKAHSPEQRKRRAGDAFSALEALWNHSFWDWKTEATVGNEYCSFVGDYYDSEGISLRKAWIQSLGLWYENEFEESDFDSALELGSKIIEHFDELCLWSARELHPVILKKFRTDLPIIFFNRESPNEESMGLTRQANHSRLLSGYASFIRAYCGVEWGDFIEKKSR